MASSWHRDAYGRVRSVSGQDVTREHYIDPSDGRLRRLAVQRMDPMHDDGNDGFGDDDSSGWVRIGTPRKDISPVLRLVYWAYSSVLEEGSERRRWDGMSTMQLVMKWIPCCLFLILMLLIPQNLEGQTRNNGYYDRVHYRDWGYAKVPRNRGEAQRKEGGIASRVEEDMPLLDGQDDLEMDEFSTTSNQRHDTGAEPIEDDTDEDALRGFGPRYLCFLQDGPHGPGTEYQTWKVTDWMRAHDEDLQLDTDYVFISYTRKQFCVATPADLAGWNITNALRPAYEQLAHENRSALLWYGIQAAQAAGKRAFWIDFECIRDSDGVAEASSQSYDVYRICDIVRAASSIVIVIGPPIEASLPGGQPQPYSHEAVTSWLQQWGSRLWTLPEILLCSNEHRIDIYAVGGGPMPTERIAKRNFVARAALADAAKVRQLIDHYESSIHLTPLELISIALECFAVRQTDQFNQGDIAYALMGLLRRRPLVNRNDSSFEAFARLSLANDSDKLLERLLCMQPRRSDVPWYDIKDAWETFLWDIEPHCQVAGIVDDQTVSLDGAYGATIQWDSMKQVAFFKRPTLARVFAKIVLRGMPLYLIMGLLMTVIGFVFKAKIDQANNSDDDSETSTSTYSDSSVLPLIIIGLIILIPSLCIAILSPVMLLNIYRGKFWSTQALFIGMEGIPANLGAVERNLFGFDHGRLKWSVAGSPLSRHTLSASGECVALPPDSRVSEQGDGHGSESVFTVVDTYSMEATAFWASRPPTTVIVCGQEGGMQRAVLCSYDWRRATFAREAVTRLNTTVLDRMFRMNRFRFALRRRAQAEADKDGTALLGRAPASNGYQSLESEAQGTRQKFWVNRTPDLVLLPFMWFVCGVNSDIYSNGNLSFPHVVILRCAIGVAILAIQVVNYRVLQGFRVGPYLAIAVLVKGTTTLVNGALELIATDPSPGGMVVLTLLSAVAEDIILPCFVLLTASWYGDAPGDVPIRLLLWASGSMIFEATLFLILDAAGVYTGQVDGIIHVTFGILCLLLSSFSFMFVDTPNYTSWARLDQKGRLSALRSKHHPLSFSQIFGQPTAWFIFGASLFGAACVPVTEVVLSQLGTLEEMVPSLAQFAEAVYVALIVTMLLGCVLIKFPGGCVPVIALTAILAFAGRILGLQSHMLAPRLLQKLLYYSQYFIWLAPILIFTSPRRTSQHKGASTKSLPEKTAALLVLDICSAFAGAAAGQILGYGALMGLAVVDEDGYIDDGVLISSGRERTKIFMAVMLAMQMLVLIGWYGYGWVVAHRRLAPASL